MKIKNFQFEKMLLSCKVNFSEYQMIYNNLKLEQVLDHMSGSLSYQLKTWLLKSPHPARKIELDSPLNCWQHFKEDCFPKWLKKKFPVKRGYKTNYEYGPIYVCPHLNLKLDNKEIVHVQFMEQENQGRLFDECPQRDGLGEGHQIILELGA